MSKKKPETIVFYKAPFNKGVNDIYTFALLRHAIKDVFKKMFKKGGK